MEASAATSSPQPATADLDEPATATPAGTEHHRTPATKSIDGSPPQGEADAGGGSPEVSFAGFNTVADADAAKQTELLELLKNEGADGLAKLTPRTLNACAEEGIEPQELVPRRVADFAPADLAQKAKLAPHNLQARFDRFEHRRLLKLKDIIATRRQLISEVVEHGKPQSIEQMASDSVLLEERRRKAEKAEQLVIRQRKMTDERREATERTADEAAKREAENMKRRAEIEAEQEAKRKAKLDAERRKEAARQERVLANQIAEEEETRRRNEEHAAHEVRREARLAAEREEIAKERRRKLDAKDGIALAAWNAKEETLMMRTESIVQLLDDRQTRLEERRKREDEESREKIRAGIAREQRAQESMREVDRREQEEARKTQERLDRKQNFGGKHIKDKLVEHRRKLQAEHCRKVAEAIAANKAARDQTRRRTVENGERRELKRQDWLDSQEQKKVDEREAKRDNMIEHEERVRRMLRQNSHQDDKKREELRQKQEKYWAQKKQIQKLEDDRKALKYQLEAEAIRTNSVKETMAEISARAEPGPTKYDNRFYSMGELRLGGKYGRIGTVKCPPAFSMARRTPMNSLTSDMDQTYTAGQDGPGPGETTQDVLASSSKYPSVPKWSIGHRIPSQADKEANSKPGPADTVSSDKQLQLTKYKSEPNFTFGTKRFQELHKQEVERAKTPGAAPTRLSYTDSRRYPGVYSYDFANITTSLKKDGNMASGMGVAATWGKDDRFHPFDTNFKDNQGHTTFTKAKNIPGPQKYRPNSACLAPPLAF